MQQYQRRAVKFNVTLPQLHRLLKLGKDLRIMTVYYFDDQQTMEFTVEGPTLARVDSVDAEPPVVSLATLDTA